MVPSGWGNRNLVVPPIEEVPPFAAGIFPLARRDGRHMPGAEVKGGVARYGDLQAFVWYHAGGMLTLNRGRRRIRRTARGVEDVAHRRG
nr:hypothetical protein [Thermus brevis]